MSIYNNYLEFTRTTAIYPEHTEVPAPMFYCALGVADEAGELLEKAAPFLGGRASIHAVREEVFAELGDVMWYVARLADHAHVSLDSLADTEYTGEATIGDAINHIVIKAAFVCGRTKKIIRDGIANTGSAVTNNQKRVAALGDIIAGCRAVARYFGEPLEQVLHKNMQKLSSRKERGVLQGDGDHR